MAHAAIILAYVGGMQQTAAVATAGGPAGAGAGQIVAGIAVAVVAAAVVFSALVRGGATAFELAGLGLCYGVQTYAEHCTTTTLPPPHTLHVMPSCRPHVYCHFMIWLAR